MSFAVINIPDIPSFRKVENKLLEKYKWYSNSPSNYILAKRSELELLSIIIKDKTMFFGPSWINFAFCHKNNITNFIEYNKYFKRNNEELTNFIEYKHYNNEELE